MQQITEQQILSMAPNSAAAANGKKISQKGGFVSRLKSADDTFYMGECQGSGAKNYITSIDFIDGTPVCRCSCPSRQFPCKHSLALLYEMLEDKDFPVGEIPEDILQKRQKKQARAEKQKEAAKSGTAASAVLSKSAVAARTKKLQKQIEGLELLEKLLRELLQSGLGTFGGASLSAYHDLEKQLGDYYLPGPQRLLNGLSLELEAFQKEGGEEHYDAALLILEKLWTLVKKSKAYLKDKLERKEVLPDDNILYEELGGAWKLSELEALGKCWNNAKLLQLSFWICYDAAGRQYIDTGCWLNLESGTVCMTHNYRPLKAIKHIKQDDTIFGVAQVPCAVLYPGDGNPRVRWDGANLRDVSAEDILRARSFGESSLKAAAKKAKNILKNALTDSIYIQLLPYEEILQSGDNLVLRTKEGETVLLGDAPEMEPSSDRIRLLPDEHFIRQQVLLGAFFYDRQSERLKVQPLSILTETQIVRLLY